MTDEEPISEARSRLMSRIRRSDTKPERLVRSVLHRLGYRFRLQLKGVPGRPDIAFPSRRKAIQVHGCFWHQHPGCRHARIPATRRDFWQGKFERYGCEIIAEDVQFLSRGRNGSAEPANDDPDPLV
jgi:DNA mismatch endonuclease Vsr